MKITRLKPQDAPLAREDIHNIKADTEGQRGRAAGLPHLEKLLARDDVFLIVAREDAIPVGYLLAYSLPRVDRDQEMILLYDMEVAESHRRKGLGKALINQLRAECVGDNIMKMWVITERSNAAAVRLYESTGGVAQEHDDTVIFEYVKP
ncbi:MAG: GNAT family N-acetyltransferase [bacterium]|nr:GNAT family N-acetyltransferase [bacterium]